MTEKTDDLRAWTVQDSIENYQIHAWGSGYFSVDASGDVEARPRGENGGTICLPELVDDLRKRGLQPPVLIRFSDILESRIGDLHSAFAHAIKQEGYRGAYRGVFPIKVNQQRDVIEELVEFGASTRLGLEAGSKPELLIALAYIDSPDRLIICNGYKDDGYVETALLGLRIGRRPVLVIDRFAELETIVRVSRELEQRPILGVRVRLNSRGAGRWVESTGARSKFGLSADELVDVIERLRALEMLDCLQLLHFHIGSQITAIRAIKEALRESSRVYAELYRLGAGLRYLDIGGGLGVDYDGSKTNFHSSTNYSLQEYANDVVWTIKAVCDETDTPHPDIVSESGRALVAHHSVLVFDVLGRSERPMTPPENAVDDHECAVIRTLHETWQAVNRKNLQESYHDAIQLKDEALTLFDHGFLDLPGRALAERLFWLICNRISQLLTELDYVPEDLQGLDRALSDTCYCNFSVFQSTPDHWAVKQLFPIMPLHRLAERPERRAVLADLTCDSDGRVDQFIDLRNVKHSLEVHVPRPGEPYYLGVFLVGAYQETLGDLHNLFGDTHVVHVVLDDEHGYAVERLVEGDTVSDVLSSVRYDRRDLSSRMRRAAEAAARRGDLDLEDSARLLRRYEEGLAGYTYLVGPAAAGSKRKR